MVNHNIIPKNKIIIGIPNNLEVNIKENDDAIYIMYNNNFITNFS